MAKHRKFKWTLAAVKEICEKDSVLAAAWLSLSSHAAFYRQDSMHIVHAGIKGETVSPAYTAYDKTSYVNFVAKKKNWSEPCSAKAFASTFRRSRKTTSARSTKRATRKEDTCPF